MFMFNKWLPIAAIAFTCHCAAAADAEPSPQRIKELKSVINRHVGYAHMSRGMNMYTIEALRKAVTGQDIPELLSMLRDPDHVTVLTSIETLALMGVPGPQALQQASTAADLSRSTQEKIRERLSEH